MQQERLLGVMDHAALVVDLDLGVPTA